MDIKDLYGAGDLTDEEIATIIGESQGKRSRFDEQRQLGRSMRQQGTMGGGVRAPGVFVAESPFAMIGDLASRYKGMKDEKAGSAGLEGLETGDRERSRIYIDRLRRQAQEQGGGPQMSPVPQQGGQAPLTQFGNPNQPPQGGPPPQGGAQTFPMPEQAPMGPMTPMAPPQQKPPMAPGIAPQASPVGPPTQGGPGGMGGGMAGLSPQQMQMVQQWLSTLRK